MRKIIGSVRESIFLKFIHRLKYFFWLILNCEGSKLRRVVLRNTFLVRVLVS